MTKGLDEFDSHGRSATAGTTTTSTTAPTAVPNNSQETYTPSGKTRNCLKKS